MKNFALADKQAFLKYSKLYFVALAILGLLTAFMNPQPPLTPRQRNELKKQEDQKQIELIECCNISDVYSFDKDYTMTTYSPQSIYYDYQEQKFYLSQHLKGSKTEVSIFDTVKQYESPKGVAQTELLYVYSSNQTINMIAKENHKYSTDKIGEDMTDKLSSLVPNYKAVYYSQNPKLSQFFVVDESLQLHFLDKDLTTSNGFVQLNGLDTLMKIEELKIASYFNYLLILEPYTSNIHVFDKENGTFQKTIKIEGISKFASRGVELGQEEDSLIHPNTITTNEMNQIIYVFGKGWNGIYAFNFRESILSGSLQ